MMRALEAVPAVVLDADRPLGAAFATLGLCDLRSAARYVGDLPYGRTTDRADYRLVLSEHRGACSTKHALVAALAAEVVAPVDLRLGLYAMTEANTRGVGAALEAAGLDAVPEAHVWIRVGGRDLDLTWPGRAGAPPPCRHAETIHPKQIGAYKVAWHRAALAAWAAERGRSADDVWRAREACIEALGAALRDTEGIREGPGVSPG